MILIVTLNLFVHKTAIVDGLEVNSTNAIADHRLVVGESAIYSALMIKVLQGEPYVLGVAGGIGGRFIKNFMDKNRIKSDLLWKEKETRSVLKIIDSINMTETTFVDDTFGYDSLDLKNLKHKFLNNIKDANTVIINSMAVHDEVSQKILEEMMVISKEYHHKVIISLTGEELRNALAYSPFGVVLNEVDLKELNIEKFDNELLLIETLQKIAIQFNIKYLVYDNTRNKNIYVFSKHKICRAKYGKFLKDFEEQGSKDLLVGTLAIAISRKYEIEKMTKLLAAMKGAMRWESYPKICSRKDIDDLYHKMKLEEIFNSHNDHLEIE